MITVLNSYGNKNINCKYLIYFILITVTITVLKMAPIRLLWLCVYNYAHKVHEIDMLCICYSQK